MGGDMLVELGNCKVDQEFREARDWERELLNKSVSVNIADREALMEQVEGCLVRTVDARGTFEIQTIQGHAVELFASPIVVAGKPTHPLAPIGGAGPYARISPGLEVLLFLGNDGLVSELEIVIYTPDGRPMMITVDTEDICF